jgi:hypothetical protein
VAAALPSIVEPFRPLAQFWDPYSDHWAYMLIFAGPAKFDICFFDEPRDWSPAWEVSPDTLEAIDRHFWDWILWTEQKRRGGKDETVSKSLADMHSLMLRPMGVTEQAASIPQALAAYLAARNRLEREHGITVPRALEREVRPVVDG